MFFSLPPELTWPLAALILSAICFLFRGSVSRLVNSTYLILFAAAGLLAIAFFGIDALTGDGFNESIIYHLEQEMEGAAVADFNTLAILTIALVIVLLIALFALARFSLRSALPAKAMLTASFVLVLIGLFLQPLPAQIYALYRLDTGTTEAVPESWTTVDPASVFGRVYRDPLTLAKLENKKNIVYIYLESVERNYFDPELFPDIVPNLARWEAQALSFTDIKQARGTGWTIGGMVSSQCGIPLVTTGSGGNSLGGVSDFLAGAYCLGDYLKQQGYRLSYLGGSKLEFAGKGMFYETHGFDSIRGVDDFTSPLNGVPTSTWGLYDDKVFSEALDTFNAQAAGSQPFGLFMLTLDTHHPSGHPSPTCKEEVGLMKGDNAIVDAVRCTDLLAGRFIDAIANGPHGADTLIVVASDHLAMPNTAYATLEQKPRANLLYFVGPDIAPGKIDLPGTTLDVAPTLLDLLGVENEGFALGRSLLGDATLTSEDPLFPRQTLWTHANDIRRFWQMPSVLQDFEFDLAGAEVSIGQRRYPIPLLIAVDERGDIERLFFQEVEGPHPIRYTAHEGTTIAIDQCRYVGLTDVGTCMWVKPENETRGQVRELTGTDRVSAAQIGSLLKGTMTEGFSDSAPLDSGVVISIGFASKPSGIYDADPERFGQGINLIGIGPENMALIENVNPCLLLQRNELPDYVALINAAFKKTYDKETYDYIAIASHDTLSCGNAAYMARLAELGLDLPGDREPFVAAFRPDGSVVFQESAPRAEYVTLFSSDLYKEDPP